MSKINTNLNELIQRVYKKQFESSSNVYFGGIPILFAGDFYQLPPVQGHPVLIYDDLYCWQTGVNVFLELKTSHRFTDDPKWSNIMSRMRCDEGMDEADVIQINSRVVGSKDGPSTKEIPSDVNYATCTNHDRVAVNEGVFIQHLKRNHPTDSNADIPKTGVVILPSKLELHHGRDKDGKHAYKSPSQLVSDVIQSYCGEAHFRCSNGSKCYPIMLKLFHGCPMMLIDNTDVENSKANGSYGKFVGMKLKNNKSWDDLEVMEISNHYVRCVCVDDVESIQMKLMDSEDEKIVDIFAETHKGQLAFPNFALPRKRNSDYHRLHRAFRCCQFPVNIAIARTVHKLQGRTLSSLHVVTWRHASNWVHVVLSRVRTLNGLFLAKPLEGSKVKPISYELRHYLQRMRTLIPVEKSNVVEVNLNDDV